MEISLGKVSIQTSNVMLCYSTNGFMHDKMCINEAILQPSILWVDTNIVVGHWF